MSWREYSLILLQLLSHTDFSVDILFITTTASTLLGILSN